ncbi:MAG: hypothetical protein HOO95_08820, partial [Gallionella sp.]|nr:hypothetical protein [Gallionella sp.]
ATPAAPLATLTGCAVVNTVVGGYDCTTSATGYANFKFVAPPVTGSHTVTAICTNPLCVSPQSATVNIITCAAGQKLHPIKGCMLDCPTGTYPNVSDTACVAETAPGCSVGHIDPLPIDMTDACTAALEADQPQAYRDQPSVCGAITSAMQQEKACLTEKMASYNITMQSTAEVRSIAYQAHFRDIWDKMEDLVKRTEHDTAMQVACANRRAELAAEKGCDHEGACVTNGVSDCYTKTSTRRSHCFNATPASATGAAKHTQGVAMDIKASDVRTLRTILGGFVPPKTVPEFLRMPSSVNSTVCPAAPQLHWGGDWLTNPDKVHFYLP